VGAAKVLESSLFFRKPFISVQDDCIYIECHYIGSAFDQKQRELVEDCLYQHHHGKNIVIEARDGENLIANGFAKFLDHLCDTIPIDRSTITCISSCVDESYGWHNFKDNLDIFANIDRYLSTQSSIPTNSARLFGICLGRFTPLRFRTLYTLDSRLANDCFMCCNWSPSEVIEFFKFTHGCYSEECQWMLEKKFDQDTELPTQWRGNGTIGWEDACKTYHVLSGNYHIEIIVETDMYSPHWFTEKTAKCLYTGKPFLLLSGPGSLQSLRDMGFETFYDFIDESYDHALTPYSRLMKICDQLIFIKNHPDRDKLLAGMHAHAKNNHDLWLLWKRKNLNNAN
jgi:hypothetical protein